ncbi:hypothetical protein KP509_10G010500 [Ceratopteris richardii]|uniref:DnaJ homologue subfamily C member 28 conserved domain-containing protein n=1 Tax=Ceratopteris richardii TaxID=49495 RepID=A0A8T2TUW0_CERRI|nr:hypothetical protein KP509_10G010500 [Ceratopteris richardii]
MAAMKRARCSLPSACRLPSAGQLLQQRRLVHNDIEPHLMVVPCSTKKKESPLARFALRIQAAVERIRLKALPPQVRAAVAAASIQSVRSETDFTNVVEQRIWHSALEGGFDKLAGKGKPLKEEGNPHVDPAEDLLYRVLSKNGFAPEWVELNKEIRFHMERWRRALKYSFSRRWDTKFGDEISREEAWRGDLRILEQELKDINKKVDWTHN